MHDKTDISCSVSRRGYQKNALVYYIFFSLCTYIYTDIVLVYFRFYYVSQVNEVN